MTFQGCTGTGTGTGTDAAALPVLDHFQLAGSLVSSVYVHTYMLRIIR